MEVTGIEKRHKFICVACRKRYVSIVVATGKTWRCSNAGKKWHDKRLKKLHAKGPVLPFIIEDK